jgi:hypothetical protein
VDKGDGERNSGLRLFSTDVATSAWHAAMTVMLAKRPAAHEEGDPAFGSVVRCAGEGARPVRRPLPMLEGAWGLRSHLCGAQRSTCSAMGERKVGDISGCSNVQVPSRPPP